MEVKYDIHDAEATFEVHLLNQPDKDFKWNRNPENEPDGLQYTLKFIPTPFVQMEGFTQEQYNAWVEACNDQIDSDNCDTELDDIIQDEYFKD